MFKKQIRQNLIKLRSLINKNWGTRAGAIVLVLVLVASIFAAWPAQKAHAALIDTSTVSSANTTVPMQHQSFYDDVNQLYWAFYNNGTTIEYSNSSDGSSWTSRGTTAGIATNDFSLWFVPGTSTIYLAYGSGGSPTTSGNISAEKGTISSSSISWVSATAITTNGLASCVTIVRDGNNKLWVSYMNKAATIYSFYTQTSTNVDDTSAWNATSTVTSSSNSVTPLQFVTIVPMTTAGNILAVAHRTSGLTSYLWTASWSAGTAIDTTGVGGTFSIVAGPGDTANLVSSINSTTGVRYYKYSSGSWSAAVTLYNLSTSLASITIDPTAGDLYVFWIASNVIYEKKGVSPYSTGNWDTNPTTIINTGTNANLTTPISGGGNKMFFTYTEGSSSPWNVRFDSINLNTAPSTPTLSSPSNGASVSSTTPTLQFNSTDPDSDSLKYKVYVFNTTSQSAGNCSGSAVSGSPWDQNTSGTGWDNGATAYSSGATATFTVQTTFTRGNSYCWQAQAKDPSGSNTFGSLSAPSTFTINSTPGSVNLSSPANNQTGVSLTPEFRMSATDSESDYLRYQIYVYNTSSGNCFATQFRTINQNDGNPQIGWKGQDASSATAYASGTAAIHTYQLPALSPNTTYCWSAGVIDPGGSNTLGFSASTWKFTTQSSANPKEVHIGGSNTSIGGNVTIKP